MYKTKKEVDAHVRNALSRVRTQSERNLRSFTIAKLYNNIGDYASAEQYLCSYLSVKEDNDQAHKLLGLCYQHLKKPEKALQSFQRSLQLNVKQPSILEAVCQLLLQDKNFNAKTAKYWCDLAESEKVQHDAVFSLRLKLMNKDHLQINQVEELIQKEISARPNDVQLRVRLVRNYIEQNKLLDAFKYVYNLEMSLNDDFASSSEWYNIVWLVLSKYEQLANTKKDWEFWLLITICLERQVYISFSVSSTTAIGAGVTETANLLFKMDQYLFKISQLSDKFCAQKELVAKFLDHYRGQLLLHSCSLIFKRELLQNKNKWKETVKSVLPLLLLAFQIEPPENNREPWMKHCDEQGKMLLQLWNREASFRCAQVGRTLLSCIIDETLAEKENITHQMKNMLGNQPMLWDSSDELLAQICRTCSDKQWRRNIFSMLFCNSDQKVKEHSSLLIKSAKLAEPTFELPTHANIELCEEAAQYLKPQSLQHMVYMCLGNDNLAYTRAKYFSGLNFSTQNLTFCGAESLNQLDVDTFLYAASLQAKRMLEVERDAFDNYNSGNRSADGKPRILPFVNLQAHLCSDEQANWWMAAYQVYKNLTTDNLAELRANLQFGIEAVRGVNGPKIDMSIVFQLGQIFVARANDSLKPMEKAFLETRAASIYKYGLNMVKMNNKGVLEPFRKYFTYANSNTSAVERQLATSAEEAVTYLASRFFKKAEYEDLIEELSGINLPFATYLQAEAYRKLDEANKTPRKAKRMYLDSAMECLHETHSLLKNSDPNHPLNSVIQSELKRLQQSSNKFINDSANFSPAAHNNSSTYEDAEADFFSDHSVLPTTTFNRSRREAAAAALIASPRNTEMESIVKQMSNMLIFVKEEIVEKIKPEIFSMHKEVSSLKEKVAQLEESMKKTRISSHSPARDEAANVLDDLYMIEDALQNQMYQQTPQTPHTPHLPNANNMFSSVSNGPASNYAQQQQRIHTPNAMQMQQSAAVAAAAAYNNSIFNPNFPMNYYTPPYMMTPQGAAGAGPMLGQRNPLSLPFMDAGGMNFNAMQSNTPLLGQPNQDGRSPNLYGLLSQQQNTTPQLPQLSQLPQLPVPMQMSNLTQTINSVATGASAPPAPVAPAAAPTVAPLPLQTIHFNKTLNNQPVEKGPPANVVITSSDPLPNPNSVSLQTQQPTLSVTIPSHHIKQSLVQTPDAVVPPAVSNVAASFSGFNLNTSNSPFGGFGSNAITPVSSGTSLFSSGTINIKPSNTSVASSAISTTTFSFKPQVAQAAAQMASAAAEEANESASSDVNRSGTDPEAEYDPRPDFQPIIPLPDEIVVKTGEEDEEIMFCHRAKLFRNLDKEWKERGIGDIKILKNKEGYSRVIMRRDQTHKICANHKITKEIILTTPKTDARGYIWVANDFADEQLKLEKFFVRFKLPETAQQFIDAFKKAQQEAEYLDQQSNAMQPPMATAGKPADKTQKSVAFALPKNGVANFATSTPAVKGEAGGLLAKPINDPPLSSVSSSSATAGTTSVSKTLFGGMNLPAAATKAAEPSKQGPSPFATFSFEKSSGSVPTSTANTSSPFANIFSNLSKSAQPPFGSGSVTAFQTSPFTTSTTTATLTAVATPPIADTNQSNASEGDDEYVPTAEFNPVIPLPDLVEVSTGEENEIVLFEHRAKLLRFDKEVGEWKERGLGNIKVLQDERDVNRVRLVMRREQIHKLCCNQRLYKDTSFKYAKNSQTALSWAGQDYSENELITEMLTVRFKTSEICQKFHEAILNAQANMSSAAEEGNVKKQETEDKKNATEKATKKDAAATKGFGDAFKPKTGSWSCNACYISNPAENLYCLACDSPKDDTVPKKEPTSILATTTKSTFSFGFAGAAAGANANASAGTTNAKPSFSFGTSSTGSPVVSMKINPPAAPSKPDAAPGSGFGDQFKPKVGSWNCADCYLSNTADADYCQACDAPKDATIPKKEATNNVLALSNPGQKFSFGFAAAGTNAADGTDSQVTSTGGFSFGKPSATQSDPTQSDPTKSAFGSLATAATGEVSKSFSFTPPSATSTTLNALLAKPTFSFSMPSKTSEASDQFSLDKKDFSFTMKPKSPGKGGKSPLKFGGAGGDADGGADEPDDDYHEEEENNTYFTPVIPLPDKIDVKTGEEDEDLLYVHRAKLYRFFEGEWKERGLGDLKILRHKETQKLRVVMRREQVLKICLNHALNDDVEYKRKDDKSWLFVVNDFSEGAVELEKFSLRFKSKEIAQVFMDTVKNALAGTAPVIDLAAIALNTPTNTTVPTMNISEADKKTADKLMLPHEFFTPQETCSGCRGCDPDVFDFSTINKACTEQFLHQEDTDKALLPLEMPAITLPKLNRSLLKQSALSPATPALASGGTTKANESIFSGFGGPNSTALAAPTEMPPVNTTFSFTAAMNSVSAPTEAKTGSGEFLFGGGAAAGHSGGSIFGGIGEKKTLFGQAPSIFANANTNNATKSIFGGTTTANSAPNNSASGGSIFGTTPIFGGSPSLFGGAAAIKTETTANDTTKSIFGNSANGTGNSLFEGPATFSGFGNNTTASKQYSIFGGSSNTTGNSSLFGGGVSVKKENAADETVAASSTSTLADLSSKAGDIDFASLAAKASFDSPATKSGEKPGAFIGLTNQDAFSSFLKPIHNNNNSLNTSKSNDANANESHKSVDAEGGAANDENYDPHYEPIIALPNEIVVSTGEENETKLFGERATLYRWDDTNKEWKERGVGEMKILMHSAQQTYRLVMRREQIHKLVLNQAVGAEFTFNNMNNNPKSLVWGAMNYAENNEGELEKLAVRFKKVELAEKFSRTLNESIESAKRRAQQTQD